MADKAKWYQNLYAFFDPTVAVNDEGYLVEADGFFDSGSDSTDYITDLSGSRDFWYGHTGDDPDPGIYDQISQNGAYGVPFSSSDAESFSDSDEYINDLYDEISEAADQVNQSSVTAADRAMEFQKEQIDELRKWQEKMTELNWNRQLDASNTSYQRAMEDLKKAGLNPKLVAKLGGASTPSVSVPSSSIGSSSMPSFQMANFNALSSLLSTYVSGADALDRNQNDFVQRSFGDLLSLFGVLALAKK